MDKTPGYLLMFKFRCSKEV